jgi:hypothetical protein
MRRRNVDQINGSPTYLSFEAYGRLLEYRFLGSFSGILLLESLEQSLRVWFKKKTNKCLCYYVACLPACTWESVTKTIEYSADSRLLNNTYLKSIAKQGQAWWYTPGIPAIWEVESQRVTV